jgi:hypothetical protein
MRRLLLALLAPLGTLVVPSTTHAVAVRPHHPYIDLSAWRSTVLAQHATTNLSRLARVMHVSLPTLRREWQNVATCEVAGNWHMQGPFYSGIGFLNSTWIQYGGRVYAPLAGQATMDEQILVGMHITGGYVPDQYGCSRVGW